MSTTELSAAERWLRGFADTQQATVRSWFDYAVEKGARSPEGCLSIVARLAESRLDWATTPETRALCANCLTAQNERGCHQRQCSYSTLLFRHLREAMNHPKVLCQNLS
jgi:hypothetical protein